jgi:hypothetical protein
MWRSLIPIAACALASCHDAESDRARQIAQQREEEWYQAARQPRPSEQLVDHIEDMLKREPCVGNLERWSRFYAFNMFPEKTVDTGIVDFHFEGVGWLGITPGRHITFPDVGATDARDIRMVTGDYDVKEDRIRIGFCGSHVRGPEPGDMNNMNAYLDELKRRRSAHQSPLSTQS